MSLPRTIEPAPPSPAAHAPVAAKPRLLPSVAAFAAVNGAALLTFVLGLRVAKIVTLTAPVPASDWLVALAPEVGFVVLLQGLLMLLTGAWTRRSPAAPWRWIWLGLHAMLMLVLLVDHQFYLNTGGALRSTEALYTLRNLRQLTGLLGTGVDSSLFLWAALGISLLAFGRVIEGRLPRSSAPPELRTAGLAGVMLGLLLLAPTTFVTTDLPFRSAAFIDIFSDVVPVARVPAVRDAGTLYVRPSLSRDAPVRRPDIVLVIVESTRAEVLDPAPEGKAPMMPFLAELARESVVVDQAYTTVPHTSKALVGMLCGMYPRLQMQISESRPGNLPLTCLPHLLQSLGYRTAFMQTALGRFENRPGLARNLGYEEIRTQEQMDPAAARTGYLGMDEFAMLEPATRWLGAGSGQPSFLTLLTVTAHHPYQVPETDLKDRGTEWEGYVRSLGHVDAFLRALHERIRGSGLVSEDAVLIVVGDHGEAFGEHQRRQHDVVPYEEVLRVPWLIHGPAWVGRPGRVQGLRSHLDLVPTVLEWLGVRHDGTLPGRPLSDPDGHESVMSSCWYDNYCAALRVGDHKFVFHYDRWPTEVFHLPSDPLERRNLASTLPSGHVDAAIEEMLRIRAAADGYYGLLPVQP